MREAGRSAWRPLKLPVQVRRRLLGQGRVGVGEKEAWQWGREVRNYSGSHPDIALQAESAAQAQ